MRTTRQALVPGACSHRRGAGGLRPARGIDAHRFYGSALMLPFFLAALMGSASDLAFRRRAGPAAPGTSKASVLLATFAWCVICLSAMVVVEWAR
jgi:hypothetical protein